ncbi:hypothetical protein ABPG72_004296 [Tetrahymena utriculariae]
MSAFDLLEKELQGIAYETKKKWPQIKDMVNELITELNNAKKRQSPQNNQQGNVGTHRGLQDIPLGQYFKVIDLLKDTKQQKIYEHGLNILQRLINQPSVTEVEQTIALNFLYSIKDIKDEKLQIKLIQSLLVMFNLKTITCKYYDQIEKILNICLTLQNQKEIIVHNTSLAGMFQLINIVFEHYIKSRIVFEQNFSDNSQQFNQTAEEEYKEQISQSQHQSSPDYKKNDSRNTEEDLNGIIYSPQSYEQITSTCARLFGEIIQMLDGKKMPSWVPQGLGITTTYQEIAFDLILAILKQAGKYIRSNKQLMHIIYEKLAQFAYDNIKSDYSEFKFGIRIIKLCCRLTYNLRSSQHILQKICETQKKANKIFIFSYIYSEYFNQSLSDTKYINHLYQASISEDQNNETKRDKGLVDILESIQAIASNISKLPDQELRKVVHSNIKSKIIDRNEIDFQESPQISLNMLYKILTECTTHFTDSLCRVFQEKDQELTSMRQKQSLHQEGLADQIIQNSKQHEGFEEIVGIIEQCWKENLRIVKKLLQKQVNEQYTQNILKAIQSWVRLAGTLQLNKISDEYLKVLSNNSVSALGEDFTSFNLLCTKTLFNIALCLGDILGTSSWHIILQSMQKLDNIFLRKLYPEEQQRKEDTVINSEIQIQQNLLNNLFSQSSEADDNLIITMIDALNQVNLSALEVAAIEQPNKKSPEYFNQKFGLLKMQETILVNIFRIELFWDLVGTHFLMLANKRYNELRLFSLDILNNIINKAFNFFMNVYPTDEQELSEELSYLQQKFSGILVWNRENWQETLLNPYKEIIASQFPDTKQTLLDNCLRLLQNNGHQISQNGLKVILEVLSQVSMCADFPSIVVQGQKCLELIISQYISIINRDQIKIILELIDNFRKHCVDSNSIYQSVALIWNIGDHLAKLNEQLLKRHANEDENQLTAEELNYELNQFNLDLKQFEALWESIFIKLINLTNEPQLELRQSAIQTLSNLLTVNTRFFRKRFWIKIVKEVIISQIDKLMQRIIKENEEILNQIPEQQVSYLQTPKFMGLPETPKFLLPSDLNRFNNHYIAHESLNKFDIKAFEDSICQLIQSLQKIIKKGMNIPQIEENLIDLYMNYINKLKLIVVLNNQTLIFEFLKIIKDFCSSKQAQALKIFEEIKLIYADYQQLMEFIVDCKEENKIASQQVIPIICDTYSSLLSIESSEVITISLVQSFTEFLKKALKFCKNIEQYSVQIKFIEDKPIFASVQAFIGLIFHKTFVIQNQILLFMNEMMNSPIDSRFNYLMVKRFLEQFNIILLDDRLPNDLHDVFVKYFFARIEGLLELRYEREYFQLHSSFPKEFQPIWLFVFNLFILLAKSLIKKNNFDSDFFFLMENLLQRPKDKIERLDENNRIYLMSEIAKIESICIEFIIGNMLSEEQELEQYIISRMIEVLENYTDSKKHENNLNFLVTANGNSANQSQFEENEFEVRKKYISNLFLLSRSKQSQNPKFNEVSRVVLPILILRCKQIIEDFIQDEQLNVSFPISKRRVIELVFVLQQLKQLELPYDCFKMPNDNSVKHSLQLNLSGVSSNSDLQGDNNKQTEQLNQNGSQNCITNPDEESTVAQSTQNNQVINKFQSPSKKGSKRKYIIVNSDNPFIKGKKGHLIYMFSLFTDLIMTNQVEIKKCLQDIFKEIQTEMNLSNLFLTETQLDGNSSPKFAAQSQ